MATLQTDLPANHLTSPFYQVRIPCGSHAEARWEHGGADGHVTMWRFLCQKEGNAQARVLYDVSLEGIASLCSQLWVQTVLQRLLCPGVGTVGPPQHTDLTLGNVLLEQF